MAIVTTGSTVYGLVPGLRQALKSNSGLSPTLYFVNGNPDGVIQCIAGSDIAIDWSLGNYYIAKTGSSWYNLGSTT